MAYTYIKNIEKLADSNGWKFTITTPGQTEAIDSSNIVKILDKISLNACEHLTSSTYSAPRATGNILTNYMQIGRVGEMSDSASNVLYYPAGNYDAGTLYTRGKYSTPFVCIKSSFSDDSWYYALNAESSIGEYPMSSSKWREIKGYKNIQTEYVFAPNAILGSEYGMVFYNNFLYSQQGLSDNGNIVHYSTMITNKDDIFSDMDDIFSDTDIEGVSKLTGEFKPNLFMDFYNGGISCNKLCEQYDYFHVIDINEDFGNGVMPKYINTYKMKTNKSHNICITSRNIPNYTLAKSTTGLFNIDCCSRPGVVVLPEYDDVYTSDGIRLCINYPTTPNSGYDIKSYSTSDGKFIFNQFQSNEGYCWLQYYIADNDGFGETEGHTYLYNYCSKLNIDGYILVCADPDIFDPSKYSEGKFTGNLEANCFVWNGLKSKFILLCKGSELLLRGVLMKHRKSTTTLLYDSGTDSGIIETDEGEGYEPIKTLSLEYSYNNITNTDPSTFIKMPDVHVVEKTIGLQWIVENTNSFNPIPMNIQIDNFNPKTYTSYNQLCKFECNLPGYPNSSEFTCLGSGTIDFDYGKVEYEKRTVAIPYWPDESYTPPKDSTYIPTPSYSYLDIVDPGDMTGISRNPKKSIFHSADVRYNSDTYTWSDVPIVHLNINSSVDTYRDNFDEKEIFTSTCIENWDKFGSVDYMDHFVAYIPVKW